jgi:sterol 3beta-glucosyltransferase
MITILAAGTRGDVQPYIALALELKKLGQPVRIAVTQDYTDLVRAYGIECYPIEVGFESLKVDKKMIQEAQRADNPLKMLFTFKKMEKYAVHMTHHYYSACQGSQMIVYHPGVSIGYFAAEEMGIPAVLATPFPLHKTTKRPSVILYGKVRSMPALNTASYALLQKMLWMTSEPTLKKFWKKEFGRLPERFGAPFERHADALHPALVSCSRYVFDRPSEWNEHVYQNGYWFVGEPQEYTPPKELAEFLAAGEKPLYIGFGSMFNAVEAEKLAAILAASLARLGRRAVISGMGSLPLLSKDILMVDNIPHSWLFERVSAACHHGGAGTSAAAFRAGIPSVILPFALDQYAWAQRSYELGVGSKPLPFKRLNPERLAEAIQYALREETAAQAKTLGQQIASEGGARQSAEVIVECLERWRAVKRERLK